MVLALAAFTACDDDYDDWAEPQSNEQEATADAVSATFALNASTIDVTAYESTDTVAMFTVSNISVDDAEFEPTALYINSEAVDVISLDGQIGILASTLDSLAQVANGTRIKATASLTVAAKGRVITDSQALVVSSDEYSLSVAAGVEAPAEDENGYFILGNFSENGTGWDLTSPIWGTNNGDGTYTFSVTSVSDTAGYSIYMGSYYDENNPTWDDGVNPGKLGSYENNDTSLSGFLYWIEDDFTPGTLVIEGAGAYTITIDINTYTYKVVSDAAETWWLIGGAVGDGTWTSTAVAQSIIPLTYVSGTTISYTGYLNAGELKLIKDVGSWNNQWGYSDGAWVKNDGSSGNYTVETAGYYTVTLDYANDVVTVEEYTEDVTEYSAMGVSGGFNSWEFTEMTASDYFEHIWTYEFTSDEDTQLKFRIDSSWSVNWGASDFPTGTGVNNGDDIPVTAGTYTVIFNDITGGYLFYSAE